MCKHETEKENAGQLSCVHPQQFLGLDHLVRHATRADRKLCNTHYDGGKKGLDWDKHVALHKKEHIMVESLADHGYSGIVDGIEVCHFL